VNGSARQRAGGTAEAEAIMTEHEKELRDFCELKPKVAEKRQSFLRKLADKIDGIPDDDWEKLSGPAQEWFNQAQLAIKADRPIPDFEAADEGELEPAPKASKKAAAKEPAKGGNKASGGKKGSKAAEDEKPARKTASKGAATASKGGGSDGALSPDGVKYRIKMAVIKKPAISVDDLVTQLSSKGDKVSRTTVAAIRAEFRHSLKVLSKAGVCDIQV
jgi:hypothetical protein